MAQARLSLILSKCHIVGNHMSRLNKETRNLLMKRISGIFVILITSLILHANIGQKINKNKTILVLQSS